MTLSHDRERLLLRHELQGVHVAALAEARFDTLHLRAGGSSFTEVFRAEEDVDDTLRWSGLARR
jgi:hypothetical protein